MIESERGHSAHDGSSRRGEGEEMRASICARVDVPDHIGAIVFATDTDFDDGSVDLACQIRERDEVIGESVQSNLLMHEYVEHHCGQKREVERHRQGILRRQDQIYTTAPEISYLSIRFLHSITNGIVTLPEVLHEFLLR